ncbi:MAG: ParB/RepB/Spo0J family partition protein [Firmicutes bacterium]|nr:ParB/RepB/Spo0J family partition protein [Bacillota bacterium]
MAKARGLGRGLSSLIPERPVEAPSVAESAQPAGVAEVKLDQIAANPYQPRRYFRDDELTELADSIRTHGVIQPVLLRATEGGYQLIAGERRVRAARVAGLSSIPAVVKEFTDREAIELALVENLQRSDLNPLEESQAYNRLIEEFNWTQEEIGARVGKSRSHIANYLRLLQLESDIQALVAEQALTVAHAKVLLSVAGARRMTLAERCASEGWTVKQLEAASKRGEMPQRPRPAEDVHLKSVESGLRRRFGTKVTLRGDSSKGRIEIPYRSLEELERLLAMLEQDSDSSTGGFVI